MDAVTVSSLLLENDDAVDALDDVAILVVAVEARDDVALAVDAPHLAVDALDCALDPNPSRCRDLLRRLAALALSRAFVFS